MEIMKHEQFGQVRIVQEEGKPYFCGLDIATALGYKRAKDALRQHCKDGAAFYRPISDKLGRTQEARFIDEGDVYRLIVRSKMPEAVKFERWVFDEVLPRIRKTGGYINVEASDNEADIMAKALMIAQKTLSEKEKRIKVLADENALLQPKALFAEAVECSHNSILIGELAKILKQNGINTGQNRLFQQLRNDGFLQKHKNVPTQKAMNMGVLEIKERVFQNPDGTTRITITPKVTGKGQTYFVNKYLKEQVSPNAV